MIELNSTYLQGEHGKVNYRNLDADTKSEVRDVFKAKSA